MTLDEIQKLSSIQLLDSKNLNSIELFAGDGMFETEPKQAQEFFYALQDVINKNKEEFRAQPEIYRRYLKIMLKMFWLGFQSIDDQLKKTYLSKFLVYSLSTGLEPLKGIRRYLDLFERGFVPDMQLRGDLIFALTNNEEKIGEEMIEFQNGDKVASLVKNWLKDYISSLPTDKNLLGGFDKVNYLTGNKNVRNLKPQEKEIVAQIIDIYNFLKNPKTEPAKKSVGLPIKPVKPAVPEAIVRKAPPVQQPPKPEHGQSLEGLKHRLEENQVAAIGDMEHRTDNKEQKSALRMTPDEIKREVATPELPEHRESSEKRVAIDPAQKISPSRRDVGEADREVGKALPTPPGPDLSGPPSPERGGEVKITPHALSVMDDLKKLTPDYLRVGDLSTQISNLKSAILHLASANHVLPYYAMAAFQESSLFKAYLAHGSGLVGEGPQNSVLSQQEFEAIADLRREIERA